VPGEIPLAALAFRYRDSEQFRSAPRTSRRAYCKNIQHTSATARPRRAFATSAARRRGDRMTRFWCSLKVKRQAQDAAAIRRRVAGGTSRRALWAVSRAHKV